MLSLPHKYLTIIVNSAKKRTYVAFVDFEKADRNILSHLSEQGYLQSAYNHHTIGLYNVTHIAIKSSGRSLNKSRLIKDLVHHLNFFPTFIR